MPEETCDPQSAKERKKGKRKSPEVQQLEEEKPKVMETPDVQKKEDEKEEPDKEVGKLKLIIHSKVLIVISGILGIT